MVLWLLCHFNLPVLCCAVLCCTCGVVRVSVVLFEVVLRVPRVAVLAEIALLAGPRPGMWDGMGHRTHSTKLELETTLG